MMGWAFVIFFSPASIPLMLVLSKHSGKQPGPVNLGTESLAFLQYTGGTTGPSKGAMLTHGSVYANVLQMSALTEPYSEPGKEIDRAALTMQIQDFYGGYSEYRGVRTARYWYSEEPNGEGLLLFDCKTDPYQMKNLATNPEYMELQEMMADRLREELIKIGDYPFKSRENYTAHKKRSTGIKRK